MYLAPKWKQSYSILDIFRDLSLVFESTSINDIEASTVDISLAQSNLKSFKCMWTGHTSQNPVPKKGQPIPHSRKQIDQLRASQPLTIENHEYQWRYCRIKQIECSFGKVYYEARVVSSILGILYFIYCYPCTQFIKYMINRTKQFNDNTNWIVIMINILPH